MKTELYVFHQSGILIRKVLYSCKDIFFWYGFRIYYEKIIDFGLQLKQVILFILILKSHILKHPMEDLEFCYQSRQNQEQYNPKPSPTMMYVLK
jgi:hypothetical protein